MTLSDKAASPMDAASVDAPQEARLDDGYALGHRVEWTVDTESITGQVICENGPKGWCHLVCDNGCEEFDFEGHVHPLIYGDECNIELWLNADCPTVAYEGETRIGANSGPIRTIWHGDYYGWEFA